MGKFTYHLDILTLGGDNVADKKEAAKPIDKNSNSESYETDRHSQNAKAAAELEPLTPNISTDGL
ncbi:MAG: hypothetical protein AB2401_07155 [Bacillus sp. (in: firmicutes)]